MVRFPLRTGAKKGTGASLSLVAWDGDWSRTLTGSPMLSTTSAHWVPETLRTRWDASYCLPTVSPAERLPLPEAGFGVDSRRRRFRDSSIGGKVSFYPPISRGPCWILRYVRWASLFIPIAYSADQESLGSIDPSKATGLKDLVFSWKWNP